MKQLSDSSTRIGRRGFLQIIAAAGVAGALWQLGLKPLQPALQTVRRSRVLMGTQINLVVHGPDLEACEEAVNATFARMEELVGRLSRHDPGSELTRLNASGQIAGPGGDIRQVLLLASRISSITEGAFDVTVLPLLDLYNGARAADSLPGDEELAAALQLVDYRKVQVEDSRVAFAGKGMAITLDGIAKGYVVDQGVAALKARGFANVYVEAGGDLMVTGAKPGNVPWRIGVRNPRPERPGNMVVFDLSDRAVATSGDYMQPFTSDLRLHHIIDPRTGISPPELASATVIAPTVALADGLATAAMVMGPERSLDVITSLPDCEGYFITKDLREYRTGGFQGVA